MSFVKSPFRYAKSIEYLCPYSELKFKDVVRHVFSLPVGSITDVNEQSVPFAQLLRANIQSGLLTYKDAESIESCEYIDVREDGGGLYQLSVFSQVVKFVLAMRTYPFGDDDYAFWSTPVRINLHDLPFFKAIYLPFRGTKFYTAGKLTSSRYAISLYGFF